MALLVEFYNELPLNGENGRPMGVAHLRKSLDAFKHKVVERYTEGTLHRLLTDTGEQTRRAAVLALGLTGTMNSNRALAKMLRDSDLLVRQLAADALWSLWFRSDSAENNRELQRSIRISAPKKCLACLDALIDKAPRFAEAYNQRAILYFRIGNYQKSIADCEKVLQLNPWHFGAQAGMAQCYLKLRKHRLALKAFHGALRINPELEGISETIRTLENALGEEGKKDDKK